MNHLLLAAILLVPNLAFAQFGFFNKENYVKLSAITGCNATAINTAASCELISLTPSYRKIYPNGYNLLTLYVYYDWAAGTGFGFNLEACHEGLETTDCTDATDWYRIDGETYATGTVTLASSSITKAAGADDYSVWSVAINYPRIRLANILATGSPSASDKITITAVLSNSVAF
jgi:hypothetical protein